MQTPYGYAIRNNKGEQASSVEAIWAIYYHMIMGPQEESQHSYCLNDDKTTKYHKDKIFNKKTYDRSKSLPFVFLGQLHDIFIRLSSTNLLDSLNIRMNPLATRFRQNARKESYVAKADLLFLFANQ